MQETEAIVPIFVFFMMLIPFFFYMIFWLVFMGAVFGLTIFWVIMLVDVVKRDFPKKDDKLLWVLVILLAGWIGALIYYFVVRRKARR